MNSKNPVNSIKISLDCMGGDNAPLSVIKGASLISNSLNNQIKFLLFGDEEIIKQLLQKYEIKSEYEIFHSDNVVPSDLKPSSALRGMNKEYKNSSMVLAIKAVKNKLADVVVSSGNTGALMAISRFTIGMLPGIDRPAIVTCIPNEISEKFVMLDLGANIGATTDDLLQLSLMGAVFGRIILKKNSNSDLRLSLLNIGEEEIKGNDIIKNTYQTLKNLSKNNLFKFNGYLEPQNIFKNMTDVIVCDGFIGNIAIKTMEGTVSLIKKYLTLAFKSSILARIGYLFVKKSLKKTMTLIDPRNKNGAMLIGLNGIVIKSHGSADGLAFSHAINVAYELANDDINTKITHEFEKYNSDFESEEKNI